MLLLFFRSCVTCKTVLCVYLHTLINRVITQLRLAELSTKCISKHIKPSSHSPSSKQASYSAKSILISSKSYLVGSICQRNKGSYTSIDNSRYQHYLIFTCIFLQLNVILADSLLFNESEAIVVLSFLFIRIKTGFPIYHTSMEA